MKKIILSLFSLSILLASCQDEPTIIDAELHLDGVNNTAPSFDPMIYTCAARFSAGITAEHFGKDLEEVEFFFIELPEQVKVQVFAQGTPTEPGAMLYEADVSANITPNGWNRHTLTSPVQVIGQDLWIALECSQNSRKQTVGCDVGPAVSGGDMIFTEANNRWETFRDLTGSESINWNIRGQLSE